MEDIFTGVDLRECYNFDLGQIASADDFCKNFLGFLIFFLEILIFFSAITIYHALSDGGKFDNVKVITNSYQELS